ncbi:MAG: 2-5 ligase family protein [Flaviaesturariibacter sp.]|nr:2-5 ligase family protein [Flaviaesturariibacter sp.]
MHVNKFPALNTSRQALWEYLLVANPDKPVNQILEQEKKEFFRHYGAEVAIKTKSHITVANFLAKEAMEATLTRWIENICSRQQRFTVTLNRFKGLPPSVIYLHVKDAKPFHQLAKGLTAIAPFIQSSDCPPLKVVSSPHLTIARRLDENIYQKAIQIYTHRAFHASFSVTHLTLLRRSGEYGKCTILDNFYLAPEHPTLFN